MKKLLMGGVLAGLVTFAGMAEAATIVVSGNTSAGENQPGWLFNRDTSTQTPYEFNHAQHSVGFGSLFVPPITNSLNGNNDKFIAENFLLTPIANITGITYDFRLGSGVGVSNAAHFYMNVYANFGESSPTKFYDCRYNVVPSTGSDGAFTTVTFDPAQSYPVTTRTGAPGTASPHACPPSPSDMDDLSTGSTIRVIALNVGDTSASDLSVSGYFDNVVVNTVGGSTVSDFEPAYAFVSPTVTLTGDASMSVFSSNGFEDPGATATDSLGNTLAVTDNSESFNFEEAGTYAVAYTATDMFGNTSTTTRSVIVMTASSGGGSSSSQAASTAQTQTAL